MKLHAPTLTVQGGDARLTARLAADAPDGFAVDLFVELPALLLPVTDRSANPFAALSSLLATSIGEDLEIEAPVSPLLVEGINRSAAVYGAWVGRPGASVRATREVVATHPGTEHALMFSRGVDSSHTLVESERSGDPPDRLVTIDGIDLGPPELGRAANQATADLARRLGYRHVLLRTGNRDAFDQVADWRLLHGAAFSGILLALGPLFARVDISAALANRPDERDGAQAGLVAGFSTEHTQVSVKGSTSTRPQKIRTVAADERLLPVLKVCWQPGAVGNCGRCVKCLITMTNLDAVGRLDDAPFDEPLTVERILSAPLTFQFYIVDTIDSLPDSHAELRRAWRVRLAEFLDQPALRVRELPHTIGGVDLLLVAERAAAAVDAHVGTPDHDHGVPLGWGEGCLVVRAPHDLRHVVTAAPDRGGRPVGWLHLGGCDALSAAAVEHLAAGWGPGWVTGRCHGGAADRRPDLADEAASSLLSASVVRAWASEAPVFDGVRALESVLHGAIPLQVCSPDVAARARAALPPGIGDLVVALGDDLPDRATLEAADARLRAELCRGSFEREVRTWFERHAEVAP